MTLGLSIFDIVKCPDGSYGQVVGINDWSDRFPADLAIAVEGDSFSPCCLPYNLLKYRADEVTRIPLLQEDLDFA